MAEVKSRKRVSCHTLKKKPCVKRKTCEWNKRCKAVKKLAAAGGKKKRKTKMAANKIYCLKCRKRVTIPKGSDVQMRELPHVNLLSYTHKCGAQCKKFVSKSASK